MVGGVADGDLCGWFPVSYKAAASLFFLRRWIWEPSKERFSVLFTTIISTAIRKGMCEATTAGIVDPTKERLGSAIPIVAAGLK